MKRFTRHIIILLVVIISATSTTSGQVIVRDNLFDSKLLVMFSPQHLRANQLRIDFEHKIGKNSFLSFAPAYTRDPYRDHSGYGLGVMYKFFRKESSTYYGVGPSFSMHHFNVYALDDMYQQYNMVFQSDITNASLQLVTGKYIRLLPHIYLDMYFGVGYRYVFPFKASDNLEHRLEFQTKFYDSGYEGFLLLLGVKVGVML
ncbi:hypothetical protein FACS1894201_09500 [Bacteroidia bacterium]|nr:hypothetical protein FACS1894201_09500 [Bacteroidia bacterium]